MPVRVFAVDGLGNYNMVDIPPQPCKTPAPGTEGMTCHPTRRSLNGYCTNDKRTMDGTINTAQFSYKTGHSSATPANTNLRSPRLISNFIGGQTVDKPNAHGLTDFVTFFAQFLDHNIFATGVSDDNSESLPIPVPVEDPIMSNFSSGNMPFQRSVRSCVMGQSRSVQRSINCLSSAIDLSAVYGPKIETSRKLRSFKDGQLKMNRVNNMEFLPFNDQNINIENMAPSRSTVQARSKFFAAGDHRANENPVLTSLHTLFLREHNKLAKELKDVLKNELNNKPSKEADETLFQLAKRINEAQFQKIVAEEFYVVMTNSKPLNIVYNQDLSPAVSDLFSTAAFRMGHTMVGSEIELRDDKMKVFRTIPVAELFFKEGSFMLNNRIEPFLRGAVLHRAQEMDTQVVDALRNHLFINVEGENRMVDLLALNLQRARDHALMKYNEVRSRFGQSPIRRFDDITSDLSLQNRLSTLYNSVNDIEAWIGMMAEDHVPGKPIGPTLFNVWRTEFTRVFSADRLFYSNKNGYDALLSKYFGKKLNAIISGKVTMKDIIVRNTNIRGRDLPPSIWRVR